MDEESIELRKRIIIAVIFGIMFITIVLLLVDNIFNRSMHSNDIYQRLQNKDSMNIIVESSKCDDCKFIESYFKSNNIEYVVMDKKYAYFDETIKLLYLDSVLVPSIIIVEDGNVIDKMLNIKDIDKDDLDDFFNMNGE